MIPFAVLITVLVCFVGYGLWPLVISVLGYLVSEQPSEAMILVFFWLTMVFIQFVAMWHIAKRKPRGRNFFFYTVWVCVFVQSADLLLGTEGALPVWDLVDLFIYPALAMWVLYASDVKQYFDK
ncbi:hypothetical protein [Pseudoalteromonas sp. R3]|uniref:hypothetical protein n=1 Tax=Pseudoalteromonas sp. R3 TaxID=1709477 RepID=UPI0006B43AE9|nr:hypothetical protein [Pseudoalteromonas sp. R3]AZZ98684.1 hypothetical protein ELR70_17180 [Pseudoalteromonas sp. R3]